MDDLHNIPKLLSCLDNNFDILSSLESIIVIMQNYYLNNENNANYYKTSKLNDERVHGINMLSIALEKIQQLKDSNAFFEQELLQQNSNYCRR